MGLIILKGPPLFQINEFAGFILYMMNEETNSTLNEKDQKLC